MDKPRCDNPDCTVATTGKCLLHGAPSACEHYHGLVPPPAGASSETVTTGSGFRFHNGREMGFQDSAELMRGEYCHLIGVLGGVGAGKTCLLLSLYLLAAHGLLKDYLFAGSLTLQGFDLRSRGLRRWTGAALPSKVVDHTSIADPRTPSLLHLCLVDRGRSSRVNLLLTDLPGEWTRDLINRGNADNRFAFLQRADAIVVVLDAEAQIGPTRAAELHTNKLLLGRLVQNVRIANGIPVVLAVAKGDRVDMQAPPSLYSLVAYGRDLGLHVHPIVTAALSEKPSQIDNGAGVIELVDYVVTQRFKCRSSVAMTTRDAPRAFLRFGMT